MVLGHDWYDIALLVATASAAVGTIWATWAAVSQSSDSRQRANHAEMRALDDAIDRYDAERQKVLNDLARLNSRVDDLRTAKETGPAVTGFSLVNATWERDEVHRRVTELALRISSARTRQDALVGKRKRKKSGL